MREHDQEVYAHATDCTSNESSPLQSLDKLVNLRIINSFQSLSEFHTHLNSLNLLDPDRLRPQWDTYFMVRDFDASELQFSC
jgi:dCMP deaminase